MLTIRNAQMNAMIEHRVDEFALALAQVLQREMPERCQGVADLPAFVRHGVDRARRYGVESRPALGRWVRLQLLLGPGFDTDPALPWAAAVLRDRGPGDDAALMNRLSQAAILALPPEVTGR